MNKLSLLRTKSIPAQARADADKAMFVVAYGIVALSAGLVGFIVGFAVAWLILS